MDVRNPGDTQRTGAAAPGWPPVHPAQMQMVSADAVSLSTFLNRSVATYRERELLCNTLHDRQVDTQKFVIDVRRHPDPVMLMLSGAEG